jgi:hypothetical protein
MMALMIEGITATAGAGVFLQDGYLHALAGQMGGSGDPPNPGADNKNRRRFHSFLH